jgi:hypothetical protein
MTYEFVAKLPFIFTPGAGVIVPFKGQGAG